LLPSTDAFEKLLKTAAEDGMYMVGVSFPGSHYQKGMDEINLQAAIHNYTPGRSWFSPKNLPKGQLPHS
jgi:hypothetical protein